MSQCRGGRLLVIFTLVFLPSAHAQTPPADGVPKAPSIQVTHLDEENGWFVAESPNFRLYHQQTEEQAAAVLRAAEQARAAQQRKWFGSVAPSWTPKCRICFYASAEAYSEATGAPPNPGGGHTDIRAENGRVFDRCIHLHGPRKLVLGGVLPHEVTHAVLAGHFGGERVPRWADEGMAILAETPPRIDLHLRQLPRWRAEERLFDSGELIQMHDYPHPSAIPVFYAQSVSMVDFLFHEKGAKCFLAFVRDGERAGYKTALRRHYGWSFAELDRHWRQRAFHADKRDTSSIGASE